MSASEPSVWGASLQSLATMHRTIDRPEVQERRFIDQRRADLDRMRLEEIQEFILNSERNALELLQSIHRQCGASWDWAALAAEAPPSEPQSTYDRQQAAQEACDRYAPTLVARTLGNPDGQRQQLLRAVEAARWADEAENARQQAEYDVAQETWREVTTFAKRVLAGDPAAFLEAVRGSGVLSELADLGSRIQVGFTSDQAASVTFDVNDETSVPAETTRLLKSGELSFRPRPRAEFLAVYQDYVCGAVLRIAREIYALLPLRLVLITARGRLLDTSTGHVADQPILSAIIPRDTLDRLRFEALDPSDGLQNFVHRMSFKKTKGMAPIEPLALDAVPLPPAARRGSPSPEIAWIYSAVMDESTCASCAALNGKGYRAPEGSGVIPNWGCTSKEGCRCIRAEPAGVTPA